MWKGTLFSIGITALACWIVGAAIGSGDRGVVRAMRLAAAHFVAYSAVVFGVTTAFIVAIAGIEHHLRRWLENLSQKG